MTNTKRERKRRRCGPSFEPHLRVCPACRDFLKTCRDTLLLTHASCAEHGNRLPGDVPDDLIKAVLSAQRRST